MFSGDRVLFTVQREEPFTQRVFHALNSEAKESFSPVHEGPVGEQVTYALDLKPDELNWILEQEPSNLIHHVRVGDRGMGWSPSGDARQARYRVRDVVGEPEQELASQEERDGVASTTLQVPDESTRTYRYWRPGPILNQGREGACVGFSATAFLNNAPMMGSKGNLYAQEVYKRAQYLDAWPGQDYSGTSVDAGCKVLRERGFINSYLWAKTKSELYYWILNKGPVMLGMDWYEGMYVTDRNGFIRPTGRKVGGHAILARGRSAWNNLRLQNSWGVSFGQNGFCWLSEADLSFLIRTRVDMATAIQVAEPA